MLLNLLIIFFFNFLKSNIKEINNARFVCISFISWLTLVIISLIPLIEILNFKSLNQLIFYSTSLVTTTGFNILDDNYNNNILSIWVALVQLIGAIYTLLIFTIYISFFSYKNIKLLSINKIVIASIPILFLIFLIAYTIILNLEYDNLLNSFCLASAILSSGGITSANSVYLEHYSNYYLLSFLMVLSLFIFPTLLFRSNKRLLINIIKKNLIKYIWLIIIFFIIALLFIFSAHLPNAENLFLSISFLTTTGLIPDSFKEPLIINYYNTHLFILILFSIVGTFSGTTNGGIKINRLALFAINIKDEFNKFLFQHNLKGLEIIRKGSTQNDLNSFYATIAFAIILSFLSIFFLSLNDISLKTSFIYSISALTNTGEGLIISSNLKDQIAENYYFILCILMICGRFEFIGYLLLLRRLLSR